MRLEKTSQNNRNNNVARTLRMKPFKALSCSSKRTRRQRSMSLLHSSSPHRVSGLVIYDTLGRLVETGMLRSSHANQAHVVTFAQVHPQLFRRHHRPIRFAKLHVYATHCQCRNIIMSAVNVPARNRRTIVRCTATGAPQHVLRQESAA